MIQRYGASWPNPDPNVDPSASIELAMAFNPRFAEAPGFLGRYEHLHRAIDLIWNEPRRQYAAKRRLDYDPRKHDTFIWNEWSTDMIQAFSEWHWAMTVWGPNASYKSGCAATYGNAAWFASPHDTIVLLTSTTLSGLRKRIWKEVLKYYNAANTGFGHVHASDYAIRFVKGSDEAGIFGIATGQDEGDIKKAIDKVIGFHAKHVIAIVDEMQATNEAFVKACASLEAGAEHFQFIGLGNPDTELDALGQMSEPVGGYGSINPEMDRWETKRGICLHLDGLESPRVKEGDDLYPGLLRQIDIDSVIKSDGEDSPEFWRTRRGFIAPQGVSKTVISPAMITKFKAKEKAIWATGFQLGAALDPAFEGGDRCILRIGKLGLSDTGATILELSEIVPIKLSATSEEPIHYQIVRIVRDECEKRTIGPEWFALDTTGEGGGLASIMMREWSRAITHVEFGGAASKRPVSDANPRPANEEYLYRVTELWFWFRTLLQAGQIRGLDTETAVEFCQRRYEMRGNLRMVEPKSQMKARTKRSPDLADAVVVLAELFRQRGLLKGDASVVRQGRDDWREFAKKQDVTADYLVA